MSYNLQAVTAYKETNIKTASSGSLILMLYEEGIKQVNSAIEKMEVEKIPAREIESINNHIIKAQEIITELMASLDLDAGGEIAQNLLSIYSYFNQQLLQANIKKDYKLLLPVKDMMKELQLVWKEVVSAQPAQVTPAKSAGINIAG